MQSQETSRTAEYMAFFRAMESVRSADQRFFVDPFAPHFIRPSLQRVVRLCKFHLVCTWINRYVDFRLPGARTSAIARTRLIDDLLCDALASRNAQVVILGAGFDCRAYRLRCLNRTTVYEVDHPATLSVKLARLRQALAGIPDHVRFVEIDFNHQELAGVLVRSGFEPSQPVVFLWEGVTNYLEAQAVDSVLRYVASCGPGSQIIFTYVDRAVLDGSVHFEGAERLRRDVARLGEPWTFGLDPSQAATFLRARGLCLDRDLSAREYRQAYFGEAGLKMKGYDFYHVAIAHVRAGR